MKEEKSKWYNSKSFTSLSWAMSWGIIILALTFGVGKGCNRLDGPTRNDVEIERARHGYVLQERDLNNNGKVEKFYEVDGKKYFSVIDGKSIEDSLK